MNLINLFNNIYTYQKKKYTLKDILSFYVKNTLAYIENESEYKEFIFYEG